MDETKQAVLELAARHYADSDEPLYLASVGQALRAQKLWPIEGEGSSLKDWLGGLKPDLELLQDVDKPARVAIAPPNKAERVRAIIEGLRNAELLSTLARPVLLAFCVRGQEASPVFVTRRPPFKYTLVAPADPQNYHVIPPDLRLPGLRLMAASKMAPSDAAALAERIQHWADAQAVALASLSRQAAESDRPAAEEVTIGTMSALDRLIAAQRPEVRQHLVVPADIAQLLSRHK